jgi:anti-sigma regulatory factor (Ser/Thr protein kinase)
VSFYDVDADLVPEVADFVASGLAADETVVVVGTPAHRSAVDAELAADGVDLAGASAVGRDVTLDAATTLSSFQVDGLVDDAAFASVIGGVLAQAAHGGRPVRVFGEMVALLWAAGAPAEAMRLEELWNALAATHDFSLLCMYPVGSFFDDADLGSAAHVCRQHSDVVAPRGYATPRAVAAGGAEAVTSAFLPVAAAVRAARRFVSDVLAQWELDDLAADGRLIVSELATNAVRHANSPFRVSLRRSDRSVRIGVEDVSTDPPARRQPTLTQAHGRGMLLVEGLSAEWGTMPLDGGKLVWSELANTN